MSSWRRMDLFEKDFYVLFSYVCYILQLVFMNAMMILSFFFSLHLYLTYKQQIYSVNLLNGKKREYLSMSCNLYCFLISSLVFLRLFLFGFSISIFNFFFLAFGCIAYPLAYTSEKWIQGYYFSSEMCGIY